MSEAHYGAVATLAGCHNDARSLAALARKQGFDGAILLDEQATSTALQSWLDRASRELAAGDTLLLTFAGHGAQVSDANGDESDQRDETWLLFDRMFIDDELRASLERLSAGVRVFVVSDSCHSGSMVRSVRGVKALDDRAKRWPRERTPDEPGFGDRVRARHPELYPSRSPRNAGVSRAAVVQLSACQDNQVASDGDANGLFTEQLLAVWNDGAFVGNHRALARAVGERMPPYQTPAMLSYGDGARDFEDERPFTISHDAVLQPTKQGGCDMNSDVSIDDPWAEVRAALIAKAPSIDLPIHASGASGDRAIVQASSARAATGAPIARVFWWGFHIEISSASLRSFVSSAQPINAIAAALAPITGPAAPWVAAAAAFIAAALGVLRGLDRGAGVYISMSWFALGIFVPTTVPVRGRAARGVGEPYEQAGDPWRKEYNGGPFGTRLEEDIYWNLPDGTVREEVIVHTNPPGFGNIYFNHWLSNDPTVGHFRLHVGIAWWHAGRVELRMMIRDRDGRGPTQSSVVAGPRVLSPDEL